MKKLLTIMLSMAMVLSLAACGGTGAPASSGGGSNSGGGAGSAGDVSAPVSSGGETVSLRFSLSNSADSVHGRNVQRLCDNIAAAHDKGETSLEMTMFPNGQLGSVDEMLEQIMMGENIVLATDAAALKSFAPDLGILEAPYFFENEEEPKLVFQTQWFADQLAILEENGIKVLSGEMIFGSRHIMATAPIRVPGDMKGLKIRVPTNDVSTAMINAMGGTATPLPLSEVYPGIQQKTIDGMENPFATHIDNNMWEVCDYLSLTGHQITTSWYVMSADVFNSLSQQDQDFLMSAAADARDYFNSINGEANEEALQTLKDKGTTVVEDVDIAAFKEATSSVYDQLGYAELRASIYEQMDAFR